MRLKKKCRSSLCNYEKKCQFVKLWINLMNTFEINATHMHHLEIQFIRYYSIFRKRLSSGIAHSSLRHFYRVQSQCCDIVEHSASSIVFKDFTQRALAQCSDNIHRNSRISLLDSESGSTRSSTCTIDPRVKSSREGSSSGWQESSIWVLTTQKPSIRHFR